MKSFLKYFVIGLAVLVILLILAITVLPLVVPLDKLRDIATAKISQTINREVKLGKVSFNIFTGVKLSDLYIGNRKGFSSAPFISADAIEFRYDFWKLLVGKIEITKAVLIRPEILIEQRSDGSSNYGDLVGAPKPKTETKNRDKINKEAIKTSAEPAKGKQISLLVSKFAISKGRLTLVSYASEGKKENQLKDLDLDISNISLKTTKPISISLGVLGIYEGKSIPIKVSGKIDLDLEKAYINARSFIISAADEKLKLNAEVSRFDVAPNINLALSTDRLDVDKFMAILSGSKKEKVTEKPKPAPYGQLTRSVSQSLRSIPKGLIVNAAINMNNIKFKEMKLDSLKVEATLNKKIANIKIKEIGAYHGRLSGSATTDLNINGIVYSIRGLALKGFDSAPFSNAIVGSFLTGMNNYTELNNKVEGTLDLNLSLSGKGIEVPDIILNAKAQGDFLLKNGRVKKLKSLEGIADKLSIETLKHDIELKEFKADFTVANKIVTVSDLILHNGNDGDVRITFIGKTNIETMKLLSGNSLQLKLNPRLAQDLPKEYDAFKDKDGWAVLEFELTGSLTKPIPVPKLGKPIQNVIDKEAGKVKQQVDKETEQKKKEAEAAIKKQLEEKARQMFQGK